MCLIAEQSIVNELIDREKYCKFTKMRYLVNDMQATYDSKNDFLQSLTKYDLIVLDDFSSEYETDYMLESMYLIINALNESKVPIIVSTNMDVSEMKAICKSKSKDKINLIRIYSRILKMCHPICVEGADRRIKEEHKKDKEILDV